jgi:hypothetical protein
MQQICRFYGKRFRVGSTRVWPKSVTGASMGSCAVLTAARRVTRQKEFRPSGGGLLTPTEAHQENDTAACQAYDAKTSDRL